jgi:hypothetical protein
MPGEQSEPSQYQINALPTVCQHHPVFSACGCVAADMLTAVWSANAGVMARGVNWQRFTQQQLLEICKCVGGLGLAAVLRLMAEDHAGAAGGQAADKFFEWCSFGGC